MCLFALLAVLWALAAAGRNPYPLLSAVPSGLEGTRLGFSGEVYRLEQKETSLCIYLKHISQNKSQLQFQSNIAVYTKTEIPLSIGNLVYAEGDCRIPQRPSNPGQFDMAAYYGIQGIGIQLQNAKVRVLDDRKAPLFQTLHSLRRSFQSGLERVLDSRDAGLMSAMLLGEKSGMDQSLKKLYQAGGISHILAISGLHISLIGMGLYRLLRKLLGGFWIPCLLSAAFLILYGILTGMPVSAMRAILMFLVYLGAQLLGRTYDLLSALSLAGILILLEEPLYLFQAGFQLSFLSIVGIGVVYPVLAEGKRGGWLSDTLRVSASIQFTTLPCTLFWFGQTALLGPVINLAVLPLAGLAMASAGAGTFLGFWWCDGGVMAAAPCHYILKLYQKLCLWGANGTAGTGVWGRPKAWRILAYYLVLLSALGVLLLFQRREKKGQKREKGQKQEESCKQKKKIFRLGKWGIQAVAALLCLLLMRLKIPGELEITFLDVGQGDSIFWQSPGGTTYLCDGGSSDVSQAGEYRIEPFLKWHGAGRLDYLILTHMDADHINGARELLEPRPGGVLVGRLILPEIQTEDPAYEELRRAAQTAKVPVSYLGAGDVIRDGDLKITCLFPQKGSLVGEKNKNEYSLVLLLEYGAFRALLTGDLEGSGEEELVRRRTLPSVILLKAGHHGSSGSTSDVFLEIIKPKETLISYGEGNSYGHPHEELMERLKGAGCEIYETARDGAVTFWSDGRSYRKETYLE